MKPLLLVRLWLMVFLHYFVWGAWYVTMAPTPRPSSALPAVRWDWPTGRWQSGRCYLRSSWESLPTASLPPSRILAFLHILGRGAALRAFHTAEEFGVFYLVLLSYTITYMAGHGLTNTLTLHHSKNPAKEFPLVMIMASVGWIVAGLVVSWLKLEDNPGMFYLASGAR
ncbi:MAG: hypothetical protein R3C56_07595 [Pirellulaceae bacterium]